jgi:hypothetical protein
VVNRSGGCVLAVAALLAPGAGAYADVLLYEGWDYLQGDSDPSNWTGGIGFDGGSSWVDQRGNLSTTIVAALDFSDFDESFGTGCALDIDAGGNSGTLHRAVNVARSGGDGPLWAAFLLQFQEYDTSGFNNQHGYIHFRSWAPTGNINGEAGDEGDLIVAANRRRGGDDNVRVGVSGGDTALGFSIKNDFSVYLFVACWTDQNADGDYDQGELWVMSTDDYDDAKAGGVTLAELEAHNRVNIVDTTGIGAVSLDDLLQLQMRRYGFRIDEIQYGQNLADLNGFVPEPATPGLLALGGLALLRRRRPRL